MIGRLLRGRQSVVCLDFGRDRLSALEVTDGAVTRWISRPLPQDALNSGDPTLPEFLGDAVRQTLARATIVSRRARIALPDEATVSRQITLPPMARRDLPRAMLFAAERHIPFPIERARWAWDVIAQGPEGVTIYLVATWRDVVEQRDQPNQPGDALHPLEQHFRRAVDDEADAAAEFRLVLRRLARFVAVPGDRLLQRAYRHQSTVAGGPGRLAPVLLAGDLEDADLPLPVAGRPVSEVLNGQLPRSPQGFRAGAYLANLGLSMRRSR